MKILKIFSMVLALHLVLLVVFLVSPGCQSQPKSPSATPSAPAATSENWSNQTAPAPTSTLDPVPVGSSGYSNQPLLGQTPAERARTAPQRPSGSGSSASVPTPEQREEVLKPVSNQAAAPAPAPEPVAEPTLITYTVRRGDSLWSISRQFGVTIQDIVSVNPGINPNAIQYGQKIKVPDKMSNGQSAGGTGGSTSGAVATTLPPGATTYTVKSGDYLARIASQHGTTAGTIRQANGLTTDLIQVGKVLIIPAGSGSPSSSGGGPAIPADAVTITVQPGDTIGEIARNYDVTVRELMDANGISDPRKLRVGQTLVIPGFKSVDASRANVVVNPAPASRTASPAPPTTTPPPVTETVETEEVVLVPQSDLDELFPADDLPAPVIPIDEPDPAP